MSYLDEVNSPKDIKKLNIDQLNELCGEIRQKMIETVSKNGGHLASNLGVVELTVALHMVFNSPTDQIVFDVGHQCYTHKILTGRKDEFDTLRTEGGISGFTRPVESKHDIFSSGHSSTSISAAIGLAKAKKLRGEKGKVIAVIGDGALTGGLAYEALNNSGNENSNLIVVLNDNNMSISQNVGSLAKNLTTIRTNPRYFTFRNKVTRWLAKLPKVGSQLTRTITLINKKIRKSVYKNTFFEDLGFRYYGPIDGHDLDALIDVLNVAKVHNHSVLIHINTVKGKGYDFAEKNPSKYHGIGKFNVNTGEPIPSGETFSSHFGQNLCSLAKNDTRICAVTAAMATGTGLVDFSHEYSDRFFDVGIAEEHAVVFSSGLAKNGMIPFFAVYSTFLQRSYDQLIHDVAMQDLKVVFCIDRAGFVGEDGETHQGVFDVSMLRSVPDITVYSPSSYEGLKHAMQQALYSESKLVAVRYPRGAQRAIPESIKPTFADFDVFGDENAEKAIITYGRTFSACAFAYEKLVNSGESVKLIKLNRIIPVCEGAVEAAKNCRDVYFFEEGIRRGGAGEGFLFDLSKAGFSGKYHLRAIENGFVKQASVESLLHKYGFDEEGVLSFVTSAED